MRFPFYDKPWQITTIGNCCRSLDYGLGASAIDYDGKHKYIRITDIDEETNTFSNINITSPSFYDEEHKVKINDILFARTGASVGKTYCYNPKDGELYYAGFLIAAHVKNEFDPKFIFYNTVTTRYKNWVKIMSARSGQPGINADEYRSHTFYIPIKDEQLKISAFLSKLDERILLQNKIIEDYIALNKCIINKLCNDLDEFTECFVSDIAKIGRGRVINTKEISNQLNPIYPVYSSQTSNNGIMGYLDSYEFDGEYITWTTDGANAGTVYYRNGKFNCTNVCGTLEINEENDAFFVSKLLSCLTKSYVSKNLANPKLMNNTMAKIKLKLPPLNKQREYSCIIRSIEIKIEFERNFIDLLRTQKKYFLKNLFI